MKTDTLAIWLNEKHEVNVRTKLTLEQNQNVRRHRTNYLSKSEISSCKHQDEWHVIFVQIKCSLNYVKFLKYKTA